jgi:hypothetical protein
MKMSAIQLGKKFAFLKFHDQKSLIAEIAGAFSAGKVSKALKSLNKLPDRSLYFPQ